MKGTTAKNLPASMVSRRQSFVSAIGQKATKYRLKKKFQTEHQIRFGACQRDLAGVSSGDKPKMLRDCLAKGRMTRSTMKSGLA